MPAYLFYPLALVFVRLRTLVFLGLLSFLPMTAHADLQQEMDAMFGTMTNATSPTAHLGQRRGVISAGSVVSRNRVISANRVSFVPPSFSAGCGGIDLFGGSFSFINMNPFVNLMRAVDSNAAGYAFQLAINAMCPDCGNVMSDLQKEGAATQPDVLPLLPVGPRSGQRRGECVARQGAERHEDAHHRLFQGRDRRVRGVDQLQQRRTHSQPGMKRQISVSW
jgi:hypothetical protein